MKAFALAVLFALSPLLTVAAAANTVCLRVNEISETRSPDGKTLFITMRDGTVWRSKLDIACPDLKFDGFVWVIHGGEVCEHMQTMRVIHSGQICRLGGLIREPAKPKR